MAEKKTGEFDAEATSGGIPAHALNDSVPANEPPVEEMNATHMAIDIASLNLDVTSANIKIAKSPTDAEVVRQKIEEKKGFFAKLAGSVFGRTSPAAKNRAVATLPQALQKWQNTWICDPTWSGFAKIFFYLQRLVLVVFSFYLHAKLLHLALTARDSEHPALIAMMIALGVSIAGSLVSLVMRLQPVWLVTFPLGAMAVLVAYGALFFHTRDQTYLSLFGRSTADLLNLFYLAVLVPVAFSGVVSVARSLVARVLFFVVYLLVVAPFVLNLIQGIQLEAAFFGYDFLPELPDIAQPLFIVLHGLIPVVALLHLLFSFGRAKDSRRVIARGTSFAIFILYLPVTFMGLVLLDCNRMPGVLGVVFPNRINMGAAELEILNQSVKVETTNYSKNQGSDQMPRYRFLLDASRESGSFLLQTVDDFGSPVRNLSKNDLVVFADGQKVKDFELAEFRRPEQIKKYSKATEKVPNVRNVGVYLLKLKLEAKQQLLQWSKVDAGLHADESINFEISDLRKVHHARFRVKDEVLLDVAEIKESSINLPLSYLSPGDHTLMVSLYDEGNVEILAREIKLTIIEGKTCDVISPVEGDAIATQLPVVLFMRGDKTDWASTPVSYEIDGIEVLKTDGIEPVRILNVANLAEGGHSLIVKIQQKSGVVENKIGFSVQKNSPVLIIDSPAMGSFAARDTEIAFHLGPDASETAGMKVLVNGDVFTDFVLKDNVLTLPVSRWSHAELYVALQATLKTGERVSDWLVLNKGQGQLAVSFDRNSLGFLGLKSLAIVFDASVSMYDNWLGSSKWLTLRSLVTNSDIERVLEKLDPSIVVFGHKKPQYLVDCTDAAVVVKKGRYDKAEIGKTLAGIKPSGVSSLVKGLELALADKPDRIVLFTDGTDTCKSNIQKALAKKMGDAKTIIDIFAIGLTDEKAKVALQSLASATGGVFYQPQSGQLMQKLFVERMNVNFQLVAGEKIIYEGPLDNKSFDLVPGSYILRIADDVGLVEVGSFVVNNGQVTKISISGDSKSNKIKVNENVAKN